MKRYILLGFAMVAVLSAQGGNIVFTQVAPDKGDELILSEIENQSTGFFKTYQVGMDSNTNVVFPESKLEGIKIVLTNRKLNVYPIDAAFQSIFIERGQNASGNCVSSKGPFYLMVWYGFPQSQNRLYENYCLIDEKIKPEIGLRIHPDGSVALYEVLGLKQVAAS